MMKIKQSVRSWNRKLDIIAAKAIQFGQSCRVPNLSRPVLELDRRFIARLSLRRPNHDINVCHPAAAANNNGNYIAFWVAVYQPSPLVRPTCRWLWRVTFSAVTGRDFRW